MNILLAGKHGMNVDTMIIAHVDPAKKRVALLSIPRDLFYKGRKINSVYAFHGMEEVRKQLSEITGLSIQHSALIDMYAFIDVIDLLGGVDVALPKPVIDPTYKTFDYGKWGTLYYEAGTHHLNGTEALRVARSRHFSSDFARAENQHLILAGLRKKVQDLGVGDAYTIAKMVNVVLNKTETDLSAKDALSYYWRFKDYELKSGLVLSTGNVLTSQLTKGTGEGENQETPKEGCTLKLADGKTEVKTACIAPGSAYILVPRKDWAAVKAYVKWVIEQ